MMIPDYEFRGFFMLNVFRSYTTVVKGLIKRYDHELSLAFHEDNLEEVIVDHDNWDGGQDYYDIHLQIPLPLFCRFRDNNKIDEAEGMLTNAYSDALRGENHFFVNHVSIRPGPDDNLLVEEALDESMWKSGFFRLFLSHRSESKDRAHSLKSVLSHYGIDCFVAHDDIITSSEWEKKIVSAMFTMDAMCAILVPDSINSEWCDQEVGFALGQNKLVIPLNAGSLPYGLLGKYQAMKAQGRSRRDVACNLWKVIVTNELTRNSYLGKLISLISHSFTSEEAINYIQVLSEVPNVSRRYVEQLRSDMQSNDILMADECRTLLNDFFVGLGLDPVEKDQKEVVSSDSDEDLPF